MMRIVVGVGGLIAVAVIALLVVANRGRPALTDSASSPPAPATQRATAPATQPTTAPVVVSEYIQWVRSLTPALAKAELAAFPGALDTATTLTTTTPVYLDRRGDLWITSPAAPELDEVLRNAPDQQTHLTRERIVFAYWQTDDAGRWHPTVITRDDDGRLVATSSWGEHRIESATQNSLNADTHSTAAPHDMPTGAGRLPHFDFARAFPYLDGIVAPADQGIAFLRFPQPGSKGPIEVYFAPLGGDTINQVQAAFIADRVVAYRPWDVVQRAGDAAIGGSDGAVLFDAQTGQWNPAPPELGWASRLAHVVPYADGSALLLTRNSDQTLGLTLTAPPSDHPLDRAAIEALVTQLADLDQNTRDNAYARLAAMGPTSWPVLESLMEAQPPASRQRIARLLSRKLKPSLGIFRPVDQRLFIHTRLADGGIVLYSDTGVWSQSADGEELVSPAWLALRPGRRIAVVPPALTANQPAMSLVLGVLGDEWFRGSDRWMGNHVTPITKAELPFKARPLGIDRRGRWLLVEHPPTVSPEGKLVAHTVIVDPNIIDPTPRLPLWPIVVDGGHVGWTSDGWPILRKGGTWKIGPAGFQPVDPTKVTTHTADQPGEGDPAAPDAAPGAAPGAAPDAAAVAPALDAPVAAPPAIPPEPILITSDGARIYLGSDTIRIIRLDAAGAIALDRTSTLAPAALPSAQWKTPRLFEATPTRFLLFATPGQISCLDLDDTGAFSLATVFTRNVPHTTAPIRLWKDPAGRIVLVYDVNKMLLMFPDGEIPRALRTLVPSLD